jgi:head-tail adaptor
MKAGHLDRRVAVQRFTATYSPSGEPIETWATIGGIARYASKTPVTGIERFGSEQLQVKEQVEFNFVGRTISPTCSQGPDLEARSRRRRSVPVARPMTYSPFWKSAGASLRVLATRRP